MACSETALLLYDLELSRRICIIKYSRVTSCVKWLNGEKNQCFEDHLRPRPHGTEVFSHRNVGFSAILPFDAAGSPRIFYYSSTFTY
jgi:hypothetical protein